MFWSDDQLQSCFHSDEPRNVKMSKKKNFLAIILIINLLLGCTTQQPVKNLRAENTTTETSNEIKAFILLTQEKAESGDLHSQYILGLMYVNGEGVSIDYTKAAYWLLKAAQNGNADAQRNLGYLYGNGLGLQRDYDQAVVWYRKAAEQGLASAQVNLGFAYSEGKGVPQNHKIAVEWYKKAAIQGDSWGQHNLARCYIDGEGVSQNFVFAYVWSSLAAAQGHKDAATNRDIVATRLLNSEQLSYAQELATEMQYKIEHPNEEIQTHPSDMQVTREPQLIGSGTGFLVSKNGYIITCYHVISDAHTIKIRLGDETLTAQYVEGDKYNDLALIKVNGNFPALAFSPERSAKMGQEVFTIGYPNPGVQGINAKLTKGTVSSLSGFQDDLRLYQISTPVQPGNSGGPLLDNNGNIIGVIVAMLDAKIVFQLSGSLPQNVNYAVKGTYALALLNMLPEMADAMPVPSKANSFEKAVEMAQKSTVMVLAFE